MVGRLLKKAEVAELLGIAPATLSTWRSRQRYPLPYVRCGRAIRYRAQDVEKFVAERTQPGDGTQPNGG